MKVGRTFGGVLLYIVSAGDAHFVGSLLPPDAERTLPAHTVVMPRLACAFPKKEPNILKQIAYKPLGTVLVVLAAVFAGVAGCESEPVKTTTQADGTVVSATGVPQLKNPPAAPTFGELTTIAGTKISVEALRGKVLMLDFWATWCGPCRMSIPILNQLHDKYGKDGLVIVGISDETAKQVKPFAEQIGMRYTVVADPVTNRVWQQNYQVESLPSLVVIDRKGKLRLYEKGIDTTSGRGTRDRLTEIITQLLAEK